VEPAVAGGIALRKKLMSPSRGFLSKQQLRYTLGKYGGAIREPAPHSSEHGIAPRVRSPLADFPLRRMAVTSRSTERSQQEMCGCSKTFKTSGNHSLMRNVAQSPSD